VPDQASDNEVVIVLLQDGVTLTHLPAHRIYALSDDATSRQVTSTYPMISYGDMLRMIFEADAVIAL